MSKGTKKRSKDIDELHEIVYEGTVGQLRELLNAGADPNVKNPRNETPLHVAMAHGKTWAIEPLIKAGANPNKMPYHGLYV
jgi:ankyrin repeat protein